MELMVTLGEQTVADTAAAAIAKNMTFSAYVEWRLNVELDAAAEAVVPPLVRFGPEGIAQTLFDLAGQETCVHDGGRTYLVEKLYTHGSFGEPWSMISRGNRIAIGKLFKRLVDSQLPNGFVNRDGKRVKVERAGLTQQNQAVYRTVKVV